MDEFPNLRAQRPEGGPATPAQAPAQAPVQGANLPLPEPADPSFDFDQKPSGGFVRDVLPAVVMIVAVVGLGVLGWYAYKEAKAPKNPEEIPIVKAEEGPYKTKPTNPGGMEFANTDKSVYDMIGDSSIPPTDEKVEQVIGKPEEPVARDEIMPNHGTVSETEGAAPAEVPPAPVMTMDPQPSVSDATIDKELAEPARKRIQDVDAMPAESTGGTTVAAPVDIKLPSEKEIDAMKQEEESAPVPVPPETVERAAPKKEVAKTEDKVSAKVKAAAAAIPKSMQGYKPESKKSAGSQKVASVAKKSAGGKFRVQLGAYRSESAAADAWKNISKRYSKELSGLDMHVEKANLGTKGIFYRLQAGSFGSEEDARLVCNKLVSKKQGCLAVGG